MPILPLAPRRVPPAPATHRDPPPVFDLAELAREPNTAVNLGALMRERRDDGFPSEPPPTPPRAEMPSPADASAKTQRPPPSTPPTVPSGMAGAVAFFAVAIGIASAFVVVVHERRRAEPHAALARPPPTTSASAAPTVGAVAAVATAPAPATAAPEPVAACTPGETRVLVRGARIASGVEIARHAGRVAVAVTTSPREARAVEVDPASLKPRATARWTTTRDVHRAVPVFASDDELDVTGDDGGDAQRGAAIDADTFAVVFRHAGAVWVETTRHGAVVDGPFPLAEAGRRVGAPSVVVTRAHDVVVAWAERAERVAAGKPAEAREWTVHWTRWTPGMPPERPRALGVPNAIAPSISELPGGGGLVLAWTQGSGRSHEVRAAILDERGAPRGEPKLEPLLLSPAGANAGQEQLTLEPDGRGVVFFLASQSDGRFALVARALSCVAH